MKRKVVHRCVLCRHKLNNRAIYFNNAFCPHCEQRVEGKITITAHTSAYEDVMNPIERLVEWLASKPGRTAD